VLIRSFVFWSASCQGLWCIKHAIISRTRAIYILCRDCVQKHILPRSYAFDALFIAFFRFSDMRKYRRYRRILLDNNTSSFVYLKRQNSFCTAFDKWTPCYIEFHTAWLLRLRSYVDTLLHLSKTFAVDRRDRLFNMPDIMLEISIAVHWWYPISFLRRYRNTRSFF